MAYVIQGIVADAELLGKVPFPGAVVVPLPQGKALVPLTGKILQANKIPICPLTDEGLAAIPWDAMEAIGKICAPLSLKGKVAYIEAELFGGTGLQASLVYEKGALKGKLIVSEWGNSNLASALYLKNAKASEEMIISKGAIDDALAFVGVKAEEGDEFDALGLGGYRHTEDWVNKI